MITGPPRIGSELVPEQAYDKLDGEKATTFPVNILVRCMEPIFARKAMNCFISMTFGGRKRSNTTKYRESIRDVDGSQQLLVPCFIFGYRRSDPLATAQTPPRGSGSLSWRVRSQPVDLAGASDLDEGESWVGHLWDVWHAHLTKEVSIRNTGLSWPCHDTLHKPPSRTITLVQFSARDLIYQLSQCDNPYSTPHK